MEWICSIALYMVFSGILLELIADTKYEKYAKWVAGVLLLLQFVKPITQFGNWEKLEDYFQAKLASFDYALGTDRILEQIYETEQWRETSVLSDYKGTVTKQIDQLFQKSGVTVVKAEMEIGEQGELLSLFVVAQYADRTTEETRIAIPTVALVTVTQETQQRKTAASPMELYLCSRLAEFYQLEENKIEVVIQEAD